MASSTQPNLSPPPRESSLSPLGSTNGPDSHDHYSPPSPLGNEFNDSNEHNEPQGLPGNQYQQRLSRPPTAHGGPLSSHPSYDYSSLSGPSPALLETKMDRNTSKVSTDTYTTTNNRNRVDSLQSPTSPTSVPESMENTSPRQDRPRTVRRLFSLTSLRQSFSSSRTSLSMRPDTSHGSYTQQPAKNETPSIVSTAASAANRPSVQSAQRPLSKKRSSTWFRRKSNFFGTDEDGNLDVLNEDGPEHKRFKDNQLPVLPEISTLSGGRLDGGNIGWDEQLFRS